MLEVVEITLPDEEWIDAWGLARSIALALNPDRRLASGADVVTSKLSRNPRRPRFPTALTSAERLQLVSLLSELPELHGRMTSAERIAFYRAFFRLPRSMQPDWVPCVSVEQEIHEHYLKSYDSTADHFRELNEAVARGLVRSLDRDRIKRLPLSHNSLVNRSDVVENYLATHHLRLARTAESPVGFGPGRRKYPPEYWDKAEELLAANGGNQTKVAAILDIHRQQLSRGLKARQEELRRALSTSQLTVQTRLNAATRSKKVRSR